MKDEEHQHQKALFEWAAIARDRHPELDRMFAIPNGGHRHKATAAKLKAEGVKAGVPDICLPVARGGHYGMFLELKAGKNRPTAEQAARLEQLREDGYFAVWCVGWAEASTLIVGYLEMGSRSLHW